MGLGVCLAQPALAQSGLRGTLADEPVLGEPAAGEDTAPPPDLSTAANASPYAEPEQRADTGEPLPSDLEPGAEPVTPVGLSDQPALAGEQALPLEVQPAGRRRIPRPQDDAYAPPGIRAGAFLLRPSVAAVAGYESNPLSAIEKRGSAYWGTRADLALESQWSRHELTSSVNGFYREFRDVGGDEITGTADTRLRLDVSRTTRLDLALRGSVRSEDPSDPNVPDGIVNRPLVASYGASAGGTWKPNRFGLTVEGLVDRYQYEDAELASGVTVDNSDRDFTAYQLRLRSGYEVSAAFEPFMELAFNRRVHEREIDNAGFERGSAGASLAVGARFQPSALLDIEGRVGYQRQRPEDDSLDDLDGLILDGSLVWRASALTTVRLTAQTAFDETTLPGSPGSISHAARAEIEHALRRNLVLTAGLGWQRTDYVGTGRTDDDYVVDVEFEYRLSPGVALIARAAHERQSSSVPDADYENTLVEVGLRFRR